MSTKEIAAYHSAMYDFALQKQFVDLQFVQQTNALIEKINQLLLDIDWSGLTGRLEQLQNSLKGRLMSLGTRSAAEFESLGETPFPETLKAQLDLLPVDNPAQVHQTVSKMLEDPDWQPLCARLIPLIRRAEAQMQKQSRGETLDAIDRIGLINSISSVRTPKRKWENLKEDKVFCEALHKFGLEGIKKEIRRNPRAIFARRLDSTLFGFFCNRMKSPSFPFYYSVVEMMIRAGANVNGCSYGLTYRNDRPLAEIFLNRSITQEEVNKVASLLLDAGADISQVTHPRPLNCSEASLTYLVDRGLDVNKLTYRYNDYIGEAEILTPLSDTCDRPPNEIRTTIETFIRGLIFNNAIVYRDAEEKAQKNGYDVKLLRWVVIRTSVIQELQGHLSAFLPPVLSPTVYSYWNPVPIMRAMCYANEAEAEKLAQASVKNSWSG